MKKRTIIISLITLALMLAIIGITYAYFTIRVTGNEEASSIILSTADLRLTYVDGPEIRVDNLRPTDIIYKEVRATNNGTTGVVFSLQFINLINQITNDELVVSYTCESYRNYGTPSQTSTGNCYPMPKQAIGLHTTSGTEAIEEAIFLDVGVTKVFHISIEFEETGSNQSYNKNKSFYATINASTRECLDGSQDLKCKMLADNTAYRDNMGTQYVKSNTGINFSEISSDTNGKGLYYTTDPTKTEDGERVYYFRGQVENNYLYYAGYCWRIVRTNEDGSVKLRYGGNPTISGSNVTCLQTGQSSSGSMYIGLNDNTPYAFNVSRNDNAHVGYMYGLADTTTASNRCLMLESDTVVDKISSYTTQNMCESAGGKWTTTAYEATHANVKDSTIKTAIDTWYATNIANNNSLSARIKSLVADTPYCNDRSLYSSYVTKGYEKMQTNYKGYERITPTSNVTPTYKCPNENDKFTINDTYGNGDLSYPIALLTADELVFAGGKFAIGNDSYYLYINSLSFVMTAYNFNNSTSSSGMFYVAASGHLGAVYSTSTGKVLPTISLNTTAVVGSGTGTYNNPYRIE